MRYFRCKCKKSSPTSDGCETAATETALAQLCGPGQRRPPRCFCGRPMFEITRENYQRRTGRYDGIPRGKWQTAPPDTGLFAPEPPQDAPDSAPKP